MIRRRVLLLGLLLPVALGLASGVGFALGPLPRVEGSPPPQVGGPFRVIEGTRFSVHHLPRDSARAARTARFLSDQEPLPALPDSLPVGVEVYLAPNMDAFRDLAGGRVPEWGAGVAVPGADRIVMPVFDGINTGARTEARVLRHEWAHLGLWQHLGGLRPPRWFDEGYAEWASGGWNQGEGWRLRIVLAGGGPPLDSLTLGWPSARSSASAAYMLSGTAVEYLIRSSGIRGLRLFLDRWKEVGSFERAFRQVYGVTTGQFEEDWREYVKDRYGWLFVLSHSVVFWLFLGLALLAMAWIRRRRNREAMARLRASEPAEAPRWWDSWWDSTEDPGTR